MATTKSSSSKKKLVRNPNTPSLKSQGAGYSTTNRKGETTFYKSSKDAAGYSDTNQSRSNQSKGTPMSAFDKTGKAISVNQLGTTSPTIPPAPGVQDVGNMLGVNNASVLQDGLTLEGGQFVKDPTASDQMNAAKEANAGLGNTANAILSYLQPEQDQAANLYRDTYGVSDKQAGRDFRNAQQEVQQYTSQLNQITASRDAAALSLEGQGRGQTGSFVGGEQARINREAAIQALPVQAQLAAAQGNLEVAKSHVDSLFQMKVKDIETQQAYKQTVANTFMSVANAQQQNLLNAAIADSNARADMKKTAMNDAKSIAMQAIEYGQSSLARNVMSLDPTSPTYQQDVLKAMGQLRKPVAAGSSGFEAPTVKTINGVDMQWNAQTGQWENIGTTAGVGAGGQSLQNLDSKYTELIKDIGDAKTLAENGAVGAGRAERLVKGIFTSNADYNQVENIADTIKSNLLTLNTDPAIKKFFGPQMSNRDTELMTGAASTLNPNKQTPEQFKRDLVDAANVIFRAREAARKGMGIQTSIPSPLGRSSALMGKITTAPDGIVFEIIDEE